MQCDTLGNVLLGSLGSWHSWWCYLYMYHLLKHCCTSHTPILLQGYSDVACFSRIMCPATLQKLLWNGLRNMKSFKVTTDFQIPNISVQSHLWDVLEKQVMFMEDIFRGFVESMPWHVSFFIGSKRETSTLLDTLPNIATDWCMDTV